VAAALQRRPVRSHGLLRPFCQPAVYPWP
jgi:hypothetical protein